jgi:hypothetical protein
MPKKEKKKLEGTFEMRVLDSDKSKKSARFKQYKFRLEWEGQKLYYKDVIWKKIDLAETVGWDVTQGEQPRSRRTLRQEEEKRIITLRRMVRIKRAKKTGPKAKAVERQLKVPRQEFDTWLYWLLVSIQKHSDIPILEERLERVQLKPSRKGKIRARRDMKAFDTLHSVFIKASESLEKGVTEKGKMTPRSFRGKTPHPVEETGEGGIRFGEALKLLGTGMQAEVFKLNRLRPTGRIEPAAVKSGGTPALVKEARIIAALGEHPNILRLIDAHVIKSEGGFDPFQVRLFMELAEHGDLKKFVKKRQDAKKRLTPVQIDIIALGILAGLSHMHKRRIYHFDFKGDNMLMFEHFRPKIMDFGLSKTKLLEPGKKIYEYGIGDGTVGYIPPECIMPCDLPCFSKAVHLEKFDSYSAGITIFRDLIGSRYGWEYQREDKKDYTKQDTLKEIEYWSKKYDNNRKKLDKIGLLMVSHVAWMMIQKDRRHRVTVIDAFEALKGALKERQSGRRALNVVRKWEK